MTAQFVRNDIVFLFGHQKQDRGWVAVDSTQNINVDRMSQTKVNNYLANCSFIELSFLRPSFILNVFIFGFVSIACKIEHRRTCSCFRFSTVWAHIDVNHCTVSFYSTGWGLLWQTYQWDQTNRISGLFLSVFPFFTPQLLFNEAIPVSAINRATRVGPPAPIVIERLCPRRSELQESVDGIRTSVSFETVSEERLQAAVKLAKRDLRRRCLKSLKKFSAKPLQEPCVFETSDVELPQVVVVIFYNNQL